MKGDDISHLDTLPLDAGVKRRPARKTLSDMRYLMTFLETKLKASNKWTDIHDTTTVTKMYRDVENCLVIRNDGRIDGDGRRDSQLKWKTMVNLIRNIEKQARAEN